MTPEQLAEIEQCVNATPRGPWIIQYHGELGRMHLVAEVKRLTAELDLAFSPGMYLDIQKVLDEALGTEESDGAGAGIVADVALLADRMKAAEAERDEARASLQRERHQTKALLSDTADALEDLGACDDYECEKEDCTGILLRIRAALDGSGT